LIEGTSGKINQQGAETDVKIINDGYLLIMRYMTATCGF
jgi:hypothetical protein